MRRFALVTVMVVLYAIFAPSGDAPALEPVRDFSWAFYGWRDGSTGLEWSNAVLGKNASEAGAHCKGGNIGQLSGWTLPTVAQLKDLHSKAKLWDLGWVWSGEVMEPAGEDPDCPAPNVRMKGFDWDTGKEIKICSTATSPATLCVRQGY